MNTLTINKQKFWQRKGFKPVIMFSIIFLVGIAFVLVAPNVTKAAGFWPYDESQYTWTGNPNSVTKAVAMYIGSSTGAISLMITSLGSVVDSILTFDQGGGPLASAFTSVRNAITNSVIPPLQAVGYGMVAMFFMVKLLEHATTQQMTLESFVKMFTKLIVGVVAIDYSKDIFSWFFQIGQAFGNIVKGITLLGSAATLEDYGTITKEMVPEVADSLTIAGGITWLFSFSIISILLIIILVIELILMGCAFFVSFSRMFEICLRGAFLPIGLALLSENGWQGGGGRYVKKFLACCSKVMVLLMVSKLMTGFMNFIAQGSVKTAGVKMQTTFGTVGDIFATVFASVGATIGTRLWGCVICIFIGIAGVGLMFKADGLVNDIFGA